MVWAALSRSRDRPDHFNATSAWDALWPKEEVCSARLAHHEPNCQMEVKAALIMFSRSFEKHGLHYTTVLSDGDCRTNHALTEEAIYGFLAIDKDCLNCVHKRIGTALRTSVDKKMALGKVLGRKGRPIWERMKNVTSYYGYGLWSRSHDVPAMQSCASHPLPHVVHRRVFRPHPPSRGSQLTVFLQQSTCR